MPRGTWTSEALRMSPPVTLPATRNAISSQKSEAGPTPCGSQDGPTSAPYGLAPAPVNLSARQAKASGLLTSGTYGPRGIGSSMSAALQSFLASRLQAKMASCGSTLFRLTWKVRVTPSGRPICALRASGHRTSDNDCGSWATTTTRDWKDGASVGTVGTNSLLGRQVWMAGWNTTRATDGSNGGPNQANGALPADAAKASWPTTTTSDSTGAGHSDKAGGVNLRTVASWATPKVQTGKYQYASGDHDKRVLNLEGQADLGIWLNGFPVQMGSPGQLNPEHSRWLMGYPTEWGSCGAMAMQLFRKSRRRS